jgi:TonB family protein
MASLAGEKNSSSRKEKFGKFVLLEQLDNTNLGADYRAAKLGNAGLEKIVQLLKLSPSLSSSADSAKVLMDQAKFAAQLQNGNILKIFGIGKVEGSYYISYEFVEGKSLKTIFGRCRSEGFPFSVDHALLIASKICSALEYAHSRKLDGGARYYHGLITPGNVMVSYEGEVRVRGFGYWPSGVRDLGLVGDDEVIYLAPEQMGGGQGEPRSDTFAVGAILFEALTGQSLLQSDRKQDVGQRIAQARLSGPSGDEDALPKAIADILGKALAAEPTARYAEIQEMRKAIDTLLFSGDFTPTTFNLAFFMHSLFREDIERESKVLKEEKEASYFDFLEDAKTKTPLPTAGTLSTPAPVVTPAPPPPVAAAPPPLPLVPPPPRVEHHTPAPPPVHHTPAPVHREEAHHSSAPRHAPVHKPTADSREAAAGFTFHKDAQGKGKGPIIGIAAAVVLVIAGVGAYMKFGGGSAAPAPTAPTAAPVITKSPEEIAAQQKVAELQAQLDAMKAQQEEAAAKAADAAKQKALDEAKRRGQTIGAEELAKAEAAAEAARKKAEEQERKRAEDQQRQLEAQKKAAEDEKLRAEEDARRRAAAVEEARRKAAEAAAAAQAPTAAPPQVAQNTAAPATGGADTAGGSKPNRGELVSINDPGVVPPAFVKKGGVSYPSRAYSAKVEGTVIVNALIDENGKVIDTQLVQKIENAYGPEMHNAAITSVRSTTFRAATKDGVAVRVWLPVPIQFKIPRR